MKALLFSDGSAYKPPTGQGIGAWCAIVILLAPDGTKKVDRLLWGAENCTTISRMELIPILAGLAHIRNRCSELDTNKAYNSIKHVSVISDSEYTIRQLSTLEDPELGKPNAPNKDLWVRAYQLKENLRPRFIWTPRNNNYYSTVCDAMASALYHRTKDLCVGVFGEKNALAPENEVDVSNIIPEVFL
jgi:ribonuclease HI